MLDCDVVGFENAVRSADREVAQSSGQGLASTCGGGGRREDGPVDRTCFSHI